MKMRGKRGLAWLLALALCFSMLPTVTLAAEGDTYTLVTDAADLQAGDQIIIAALDGSVALGAQADNATFAPQVAIEVTDGSFSAPSGVQFITIGDATSVGEGLVSLQTSNGKYLSAVANTGTKNVNNLTISDSLAANSAWEITIAESGSAKIQATALLTDAANSSTIIQYNKGSTRFSCYKSGQADIAIYKLDPTSVTQVRRPSASPAAGKVASGTEVTLSCSTAGAEIYYTTDGSTPSKENGTEYTTPIVITADVTIKAIAVDRNNALTDSKVLEAAYTVLTRSDIADVRAGGKDKVVQVAGTVVAKYVNANSNALGCYIQDDTGAIMLYDKDNLGDYEVGDQLTAVGTTAEYNGKFELTKLTVTKTGTGAAVTPQSFALADLGTPAKVEEKEGVLVSLAGLILTAETTDTYNTCSLTLQNGGNTLTAKLDNRRPDFTAGALENKVAPGNIVTVTGYFESNGSNTKHIFHLRSVDDVEITGNVDKVLAPTASPEGGSKVYAGTVINFGAEMGTTRYKVGDATEWTTGTSYTIPDDAQKGDTITITLQATLEGLTDSDEVTLTYTVVEPILEDGQKVLIYNPANNKFLSSTYSGNYNAGVDVTMVEGKPTGFGRTEIWVVTANADGTYSFATLDGGKKLSMDTSYSSMPLDKANDKWEVTEVEGGYRVKNVGRGQYMEWYASKNYWSAYDKIASGSENLFAQQFYKLTADEIPALPVETPVITPAAGSSSSDTVEVTLTCATGGASIYYTTDGTAPTKESTLYTAPFTITLNGGKVTVKAIAVKDGMADSAVASKEYFFFDPSADFVPVTTAAEVKQDGYFVIVPKAYPTFAMSNSFAYKPGAVEVTLAKGTYAPTLHFVPEGDGIAIKIEGTEKYFGYSGSGTSFEEAASPFKYTITENTDGTLRLIPSKGSGRAITYQHKEGGIGQFGPYAASNDGKTTTSTDGSVTYGPYECDLLIYKSANGYLYNPQIGFGVLNDAVPGEDYVTTYALTETDVVSAVAAQFSLDGETWAAATVDTAAQTVTIPGASITAAEKLYLKITATDTRGEKVTNLEKTAEVRIVDEPQIKRYAPANGAETGEGNLKPTFSVTVLNGGTFTAKITLQPKKGEAITDADMTVAEGVATYTPAADLPEGVCQVTVVVKRADGQEVTQAWTVIVGKAVYKNYFGQLHSHTAEYSDGAGTLDEALTYIKDTAYRNNVQFVAFTDHSNYFDGATGPKNADGSAGAAAKEDALYDTSLLTEAQLAHWQTYKNKVAQFNTENDGHMVALAGFEMTWSGGPGHINTFNTPGIVSRNNTTLNNKTNDAGMKAYYTLLSNEKGKDSISQFNHPGTTFGTFSEFAYYDPTIDSRITLVEVGNGEGAIGSGGYFPSYSEYTKALDKGWHLAPTNNQDNHKGHWGDSNEARTVIYTSDLSEQGIYQAMRDMRLYATEDKNLDITYTVNGKLLGSIVDEVPASAQFKGTISDPDGEKISTVEIVTNGGSVVKKIEVNAASYELDFTLDAPKAGYYFLRVVEADKDIAVTAPVWLGKAKNVGMSELSTTTFMTVKGEAVTLTNQFFNNESTAATVKSLTYAIEGGATISTTTPNQAITAMGTWDNSFTYTFTDAGSQTIVLTAVVEVGGEEKTLKSSLTLDVKDPDTLLYIGIDGSHHNEYVSGNYKDSMGNFGTLAAEYNMRVNVLNTGEELLAALSNPKYKMMIFTTPTRRLALTETWTAYDVYSDAELAAIAQFAQDGGAVVVTGWGDYYESYSSSPKEPGMQMSAQQNAILNAIGSSLRVADDEAKDNVNKPGNNASRLYLTDYNSFKSPLLAGVDPSQVWSQYGGSTVYAVDGEGNPTDTLPDSVIPIISGYGKFESDGSGIDLDKIDSHDDDHDGYMNGVADKEAKPPKYQSDKGLTCLLTASETVTHENGKTSLVMVSGGAFMSNFEIKFDADNATQLGYSNPVVLANLVESLDPPAITDIATVQAEGQEDDSFVVEGYVTANTSGFDKDTAFFDCTYIQDETGGINIFPVSDSFQIGQKIRVYGSITSYQGEKELTVKKIKMLDRTPAKVEPKKVTTAQAASGDYLGQLIEVEGTVTSVELAQGAIQTIRLKDDSGQEARLFIDGYITASKDAALQQIAKVGATLKAVGIASYDNTFQPDMSESNRIRIRDRADITAVGTGGDLRPATPATPVTPVEPDKTVEPEDIQETETGAAVEIPEGAALSDAAAEKLAEANAEKPVTLSGGGVTATIPAGTLTEGADVKDMLAQPKAGNAVQITYPDGTTEIVGLALVEGEQAAYLAEQVGKYEIVDNTKHFDDVSDTYWAKDEIERAAANELFQGVGANSFDPEGTMNRAMVVTVLYRMTSKRPEGETAPAFADVEAGSWYADAVAWAAAAGIVEGDGVNFAPNDPVTREQLCAILGRFLRYVGLDLHETVEGTGFVDAGAVSGWAADDVTAALKGGIITGKPGQRIDPQGKATRAEIATVLQRVLKNVLA